MQRSVARRRPCVTPLQLSARGALLTSMTTRRRCRVSPRIRTGTMRGMLARGEGGDGWAEWRTPQRLFNGVDRERVVGRNLLLSRTYERHGPRRQTRCRPSGLSTVCHCTLAYISLMGKSRVFQLRRSGDVGRFEERLQQRPRSPPPPPSFPSSPSSFPSIALQRALSHS